MSTYLEYIFDKEELLYKLSRCGAVSSYAPAAFLTPYWDRDGGDTIAWCPKCSYLAEEEDIGQICPQCLRQEIMRADQALDQHKNNMAEFEALGLGSMQQAPMDQSNPVGVQQQNLSMLVAAQTGEMKVAFHRWEEVYADPGALDPVDVRYWFKEIPLPVNVVKSRYPLMWEKIKTDDIVADRYLERDGSNIYYRTRKLGNHAWYREYHEMPSALFPRGRIVVFCNDHVLEMKENIYAFLAKRPNLYWFRGDVFDNSIYGVPWTEHNINLQREHNKTMSQKRAMRELSIYPITVGEDNSGFAKRTELSKPGERILLRRGTQIQPYYLKPPGLPDWVNTDVAYLDQAIREKAGLRPPQSPDSSGRQTALLDAQEDEDSQSIRLPNTSEWRQLNEAILQIGYHFTDSHHTWTVNRGGQLLSMSWSTIGVKPKLGRVYIVEQDVMTRNPVLRLTLAERLLQDGAMTDAETGRPDMKKFCQVAGILDLMNFNDADEEARYASQIPEMLKAGMPVQPMPEDRVMTIANTLLDWLRSDGRYEDEQLVQQVRQIWVTYAMAAIQQMQSMGMPMSPDMINNMPLTMGQGPSPQTNPTATAPGVEAGMGGGRKNNPTVPGQASSARQNIQQADRAGEVASRMQKNHEGATM